MGEALVALVRMEGAPDDPDEHLAEKAYLLCELGEHTDDIEHAAHLWTAETEPPRDLWFLWTVGGAHRIYHRFVSLPMCPVKFTDAHEGYRRWCALFEGHPHSHSFHVADPLREALAERARHEARRLISEGDSDGGDYTEEVGD
ncbi:hypothetical protein ACIOML_35340 [Streptomyces anulatus]